MRSQHNNNEVAGVTRRDFVRKAGSFGAAVAASISMPSALVSQSKGVSTLPSQSPAASELWRVELSSDGRHLDLFYRGRQWLSGFRVSLSARGKSYSSDAPDARLERAPSGNGEAVFKVHGPASFEIVFNPQPPRLVVSVENARIQEIQRAEVEAAIEAGPDPIQARLLEEGWPGAEGDSDHVQQMVSGLAASGLNDCVFDRFRDEALRVNARDTHFTSAGSGFRVTSGTNTVSPSVCSFEVRERVYGSRLRYYKPFEKERFPEPPVGWCSFHYFGNVLGEDDILRNATALARDYEAFGLRYILIDGGWQAHGISGTWTEANSNFSHGMKWLAANIRALGLKPAVWLSEFGTDDEDFYNAHQSWFLHDASGNAKLGTWFGTYIVDFSHPAVQQYLYGIYRKMTVDWGYDYFKLDGENATRDIWATNRVRAYDPTLDGDTAFRGALVRIREAMNSRDGVFFSACGPVYPTESIGIVQSARLGGDIVNFSPSDPSAAHSEAPSFRCVRTALEGMRRGYYTHNIAWYTDPDGVLLRPPLTDEEVRTWFSVAGLTGQLVMLGDDMPALPAERRDIPRKVMPVVDIKPMDLYPQSRTPHIWMLHIGRAFGQWTVAGLFNWDYDAGEVPFSGDGENAAFSSAFHRDAALLGTDDSGPGYWALAENARKALDENRRLQDLPEKPPGLQLLPVSAYLAPPLPRRVILNFAKAGLDGDSEYCLFDFWKQTFLGKVHREYTASLVPHECQVLSIRPATGHPQLVGTDRHITMGGVELKDEHWDQSREELNLGIELVKSYPTKLTVYKAGKGFASARAAGAAIDTTDDDEIVTVTIESPSTRSVVVSIQFK